MSHRLLGPSVLLAAVPTLVRAAPQPDGRGAHAPDRPYDILALHLDITVEPDQGIVRGTARYTARPLHAGPLVLDRVDVDITAVRGIDTAAPPHRVHPGHLVIDATTEHLGEDGTLDVEIDFVAHPWTGAHFRGAAPADSYPEVWTQGEQIDHRHWFPAYDHPNERFDYTGTVHAPDGWRAVTNSGHDLPTMVLSPSSEDPARTTFETLVQAEQPHVPEGAPAVVGRAAVLADGRWTFKSLTDLKGAARAIAAWGKAQSPAAGRVLGKARFQHVGESGHVFREEAADTRQPAAPPPAPPPPEKPVPAPAPAPAPAPPPAPAPAPPPKPKVDPLEAARVELLAVAEARAEARPADPPTAKTLAAWLDQLEVELDEVPGWLTMLPEDLEAGDAIAHAPGNWPEQAKAWVGKVRGPPLVARHALELTAIAPDTIGATTAHELADYGRYGCEGLRAALRKLDSYASYRSSFPPAMKKGYDEVLTAADGLAAVLDGVWALGSKD